MTLLNIYEIYVDSKNNMFMTEVKNNLEKNLVRIKNKCLQDILEFREATCELRKNNETNVVEIMSGVLIFKNFYQNITHNCNKLDLRQRGNFLIKFENCKIKTMNKTFLNINLRIYDTLILPHVITKIKNQTNEENMLKLETLYLKQLENENVLKLVKYKNENVNIISLSSDLLILIIILIISVILYCLIKRKNQKLVITKEVKPTGPFLQLTNSTSASNF